jgi:KDO2-lipid IV(A) lauroyltransferase
MTVLNALLYYLLILPLSLLPMRALYRLSDGLFLVMYRSAGYRKKIVFENLRRSFPEKSEGEIEGIAQGFYRHFCDVIVESLKAFTISDREIRERMVCVNPYVIDRYFDEGKSVVIAGGHYCNWEWFAIAIDQQTKHASIGIYKPLSNRFLDGKMRKSREKYGLSMLPMREVRDLFARIRGAEVAKPVAVIFGIDQSPGDPRKAHWMRFLNQDTPVVFGAEKYARECELPVLYGVIRKRKRGYYEFEFRDIIDRPSVLSHGEVVEKASRMLEEDIRRDPRYWLWSHRRWKHRLPEELRKAGELPG